jgi:hypothetical protein
MRRVIVKEFNMHDNHHSGKGKSDKLLTPKMRQGLTQLEIRLKRIAAELEGLVSSLLVIAQDIAECMLDEPRATNEERKMISLEEFESGDLDGEDDFDFDDLEPGDLIGSDAKTR